MPKNDGNRFAEPAVRTMAKSCVLSPISAIATTATDVRIVSQGTTSGGRSCATTQDPRSTRAGSPMSSVWPIRTLRSVAHAKAGAKFVDGILGQAEKSADSPLGCTSIHSGVAPHKVRMSR